MHAMAQGAASQRDEEDLADDLMKTGAVEYAEPDYLMPVAAVPNDPGYPSQWYHAAIHTPAAWDSTHGASAVKVALCDTGVDATHPDLAANLALPGYNAVDGSTNTAPIADHGTAVAGIIDALGNNGQGGAGITWNTTLLPVRVSNYSDGSAWCSDMAAGVRWAADHGARVINLELRHYGMPEHSQCGGAVRQSGRRLNLYRRGKFRPQHRRGLSDAACVYLCRRDRCAKQRRRILQQRSGY